jgi:hypothetical protein
MLLLIGESLQASWKDRCNWEYKKVRTHTPAYEVVRNVIEQLDAMIQATNNVKRLERLQSERTLLLSAMDKALGVWSNFHTGTQSVQISSS